INTVRMLPGKGTVVWGARTRAGIDGLGSDFKYVPVRRLALHIEDSLVRGLAWVAFEPDAEPLWARLREQAGAFLHGLYAQGAFQGRRPQEAWFVHCDAATTSTTDQALGLVRLHLGFAPLRPAEFVLLRLVLQAQPMPPG
ncbi:MAG: phage tail sheath family protein, partial [Aquincola sp.]|nr:phage tail sheath family protein [Aquincola sp.]